MKNFEDINNLFIENCLSNNPTLYICESDLMEKNFLSNLLSKGKEKVSSFVDKSKEMASNLIHNDITDIFDKRTSFINYLQSLLNMYEIQLLLYNTIADYGEYIDNEQINSESLDEVTKIEKSIKHIQSVIKEIESDKKYIPRLDVLGEE